MRWKSFPTPTGNPPGAVRYGVALFAWAVALGVTLALAPYLTRVLFLFFWPAVLFSAWYGGFGPALLVSVLATVAVNYALIQPLGQMIPTSMGDLAALALFVLLSAFVSRLTGSLRESQARIAATARELEGTNARLQAAAAEADQANRAKSDFLATMSHELRTPLNAIAGYVELMEMGLRGPVTDQQRTDLSRIRRSQQTLLSIINDILNFARLESGRVEYHVAAVPLADALAAMEPLIHPQVEARGLRYRSCDADPDLRVRTDPEKLQQILLNLLSNAIKFTDAGGSVALGCEARDGHVLVRVRDTGRGIPPDKLEAVFEPFTRIENAHTRTTEGTGLGLAISRDLARAMGGDLTAESTPGQGSVFTLVLPRA
ncbi:MAG TPA: HAMP domain-containing sensor histidine kinase [Longimicrobium sp.]